MVSVTCQIDNEVLAPMFFFIMLTNIDSDIKTAKFALLGMIKKLQN